MSKALVLGGCGFIGSHVVDALLARGNAVTVFDRNPERFRDPLRGVVYSFGDFNDRMALAEALIGKDVVYHLISTTFPGTANLDPSADVSGNLLGTLGLLETMKSTKVNRLVYLSSGGTVYGRCKNEFISEDQPLNPINSYGIVKVAIENYLRMYEELYGITSVAVRAGNPFGPRQGHTGVQGVISTFMRCLRSGTPINIWGDGNIVRDYLYVEDLATLCTKAAHSGISGCLNAGSGVGRTLNDIVAAISKITGHKIDPVYLPSRNVDVERIVLDVSRARRELGWSASTNFETALERTWNWIRDAE